MLHKISSYISFFQTFISNKKNNGKRIKIKTKFIFIFLDLNKSGINFETRWFWCSKHVKNFKRPRDQRTLYKIICNNKPRWQWRSDPLCGMSNHRVPGFEGAHDMTYNITYNKFKTIKINNILYKRMSIHLKGMLFTKSTLILQLL